MITRIFSRRQQLILNALGMMLFFVSSSCSSVPPDAYVPPLTGSLQINAPAVAYAGEPLSIVIGPQDGAGGRSVGLVTVGSHGPHVYNTVFDSTGFAYFDIPSDDTQQSGYLALIAAADNARGESSIVLVSSGPSAAFEPTPHQ